LIVLPMVRPLAAASSCYFFPGTAPASLVVQNPVIGVVNEQTQPLVGQGWVMLQVPLQAKPLGSLRSCRAESVPAPRTAVTIIANRKIWVFFIGLSFS